GEDAAGERGRDSCDDTRGHEARSVPQPREPVGRERVEQPNRRLDDSRTGDEGRAPTGGGGRGGHRRVPVRSWTAPAVNVRRSTAAKPAASTRARRAPGGGRYAVERGRGRDGPGGWAWRGPTRWTPP